MGDTDEGTNSQENASQKKSIDEDEFRDNVIDDLYIESAKVLINGLTNAIDKETCLVWLDFIRAHKSDVPILRDYLMLLILSLHQEVRTVPFDELPPPVEDFKDLKINIFNLGERIIEANREHLDNKEKLKKKDGKCDGAKEAIPTFEWNSSGESVDYLVSQKVPGFGRQCYFTTSSRHLPLWWPETGQGDYLSRIAEYMDYLQKKDHTKLSECDQQTQSATTRNWWQDAQKSKITERQDASVGFQWYNLSSLPFAKTKVDKNEILNFFKNAENQGLEVLTIDEHVEGVPTRTFVESEKFAYNKDYASILNARSHGTTSHAKTAYGELRDRLKEKEYNTNWMEASEQPHECEVSSFSGSKLFSRSSLRAEQVEALEEEGKFCPEEHITEMESSELPPSRRSTMDNSGRFAPSDRGSLFGETLKSETSGRTRDSTARSPGTSSCRPCAEERSSGGMGSTRNSSLQRGTPRASRTSSTPRHGTFNTPNRSSNAGRTVSFSMPSRADNLDLSFSMKTAEDEGDFMDQFLVQTADITDEENFETPFNTGYEEVDDGWRAPPEIRDSNNRFEHGLPIGSMSPRRFHLGGTSSRRSAECGDIEWPDTEHIYDINIDTTQTDQPFEFLDRNQQRQSFGECNADEFESINWKDLSSIADQLGEHNFQ